MIAAAEERRLQYVLEHLDLVNAIARSVARRLPACFEFDDLVQAGRIGLMRAAASFTRVQMPGFDGPVEFGAYARFRIRGEILEVCRRRNWRENMHEEFTPQVHDKAAPADLDREIEAEERAKMLTRALDMLPERERVALRMHYLEQRRLEEVGEAIGLSTSRAGAVVRRALETARREMARAGMQSPFASVAA